MDGGAIGFDKRGLSRTQIQPELSHVMLNRSPSAYVRIPFEARQKVLEDVNNFSK